MEKLTALLLLFLSGFGSAKPYFEELDRLFLERPDDDFWFELEDCLKDLRGHWARVSERFAANIGGYDIRKFGYADEPLDYGDEKQSLDLYRFFFDFYKESS